MKGKEKEEREEDGRLAGKERQKQESQIKREMKQDEER